MGPLPATSIRNGRLVDPGTGGFPQNVAGALIGPKLPKSYQKQVSKVYPGLWGSVAIGLYNGGGYHAPQALQALRSLR